MQHILLKAMHSEIECKSMSQHIFCKKTDIKFISCRYKWLDGRYAGTATKIVFKKLILDQFLLTPLLLVMFYTGKLDCIEWHWQVDLI